MIRLLIFLTILVSLNFFSFGGVDSLNHSQNYSLPIIKIENHIPNLKESKSAYSVIEKLIPLFGVLIGFALGILKEYFSKRREIFSNGQGWIETFIQIEDPLKNQIKEIERFLEDNPENTYELTDFTLFEALEGKQFEEYDHKHLTSFLKRKKKINKKEAIKLAGKLKAISRVIQSSQQKLSSFFPLLTDNTAPHFQELTKSLSAFRKTIAEYVDEILNSNSTFDQKTLANEIMKMVDNEFKQSITDNVPLNYFKFSENFIRAFFDLSFQDRFHAKMKESIALLSQSDHSIMAIKMERRYLRIKLGKVKDSFEKNLNQVSNLIEKI